MTAATLSDVLARAVTGRYGVAGLVVLGWEDALAYVQAAEEARLPLILQAGPGCRKHTPVAILGKMFRTLADQAHVPIVCHIDHAYTYDECMEGIDHGFTSVMIDGSKLPISGNIAMTRRVVAKAHAAGVSVEGEVGVVGYTGGAASHLTSVAEAMAFDRETGADALAISVGNVHLSTEKADGINLDRLRAIGAATRVPLVLHGGSGIPAATRRMLARDYRVAKFNIGTELRLTFGKALRQTMAQKPDLFDRIEILKETMPALRAEAKAIMQSLQA